jgi:hypothetical protein
MKQMPSMAEEAVALAKRLGEQGAAPGEAQAETENI